MNRTNERFGAVMAARKTSAAILGLFDQLRISERFSDDEKPLCFSMLLEEAARRVKSTELPKLLEVIKASGAIASVRTHLPMADADLPVASVVKRVLATVPMEREPLQQALTDLERFGVCSSRGHIFAMACCAQMDPEKLDQMCILTD